MSKDVISFRDFLKNQNVKIDLPNLQIENEDDIECSLELKNENEESEDSNNEDEESDLQSDIESDLDFSSLESEEEEEEELNVKFNKLKQISNQLSDIDMGDTDFVKESHSESYYKLYQDIDEKFVCDIHIDGVDNKDVKPRLVIESDNWNIYFNGTVENGKCEIQVKKLDILKEGQIGRIKLEVLADGVIFIPWEDEFKIHKKVKTFIR